MIKYSVGIVVVVVVQLLLVHKITGLYIQSQSISSGGGSGDTSIIISNGVIRCGGIICPESSESCTVKSETTKTLDEIVTQKICSDINGKVVLEKEDISKNPFPGQPFNSYASSGAGGVVSNVNYSPEVQQQIQKEVNQYVNGLQQQIYSNVQNNLAQAFGPGWI